LILSDLQEEVSPERFKGYMHRLGTRLGEKLADQFEGKSLENRADTLISTMNEMGYQVEKESSGDAEKLNIKAHNCVYHDLALKHNEICEFDLALMSTLLHREVKQLSCMAKGDCACSFQVKKKTN